jgi:hypothetical protein
MAVTVSRLARLQDGLGDETQWLASLASKIPSLESVESTSSEQYCSNFQASFIHVDRQLLTLKLCSFRTCELMLQIFRYCRLYIRT